jgi:hypothetical protein
LFLIEYIWNKSYEKLRFYVRFCGDWWKLWRFFGADFMLFGAVSVIFGPDSVLFGADFVLFGADSVLFSPDSVLFGADSVLFGADWRFLLLFSKRINNN